MKDDDKITEDVFFKNRKLGVKLETGSEAMQAAAALTHEAYAEKQDQELIEAAGGSSYADIVSNLDGLRKQFLKRLGPDSAECHLELKSVDEKNRVIEGLANTRNIDLVNDIVEEASFRESLPYYKKNGLLLLHHHSGLPFGTPIDMKIVKGVGLWGKWQIFKGLTPSSYIEEAWNLITQKGLKALSIGFRSLKSKYEKLGDEDNAPTIRRIMKLILLEVSVVTIPANRQSLFNVSKAFTCGTDLISLDSSEVIEDGTESRSEQRETEETYPETDSAIKRIKDTIMKNDVQSAISHMRDINDSIKKGD